MNELIAWLDTVTCTKPVTVADTMEIKAMIKSAAPDAIVDVYFTRGDKVFVRVQYRGALIGRELDVI